MNIELFEKVKEAILKQPEAFDMGDFGYDCNGEPSCDTPCCIGGWAVFLDNCDIYTSGAWGSDHAQSVLDIPNQYLFFTDRWPDNLRDAWTWCDRFEEAKVAAKAIDDYIKTNGWQDEENL